MLEASATLTDALLNSHTLKALPKVIFEWNQNRYAGILKVDNDPSDKSTNPEPKNFPISSIVEAQRPKKGIIKARTSPQTTQSTPGPWRRRQIPTGNEGFTARDYTDTPGAVRYYTVGPESGYKYWASAKPSGTAQTAPNAFGFPDYSVAPYVLYKTSARVNKIVVGLENSWARPTDYHIQVTQNGGSTWVTLASNLVPDEDGRVIIYRQLNGGWSQNKNLSSVTNINGVRLLVRGMSHANAYFNLIELSARLELDMTPYVINYSTNMEISEPNFITPIGRASSNTASLTLSNMDGLFNNDNPNSIFYRLIDKNILVTLDLEYDLSEFGKPSESVREFTMYVDQWSGISDLEITAECKDSSKFLQELKAPRRLLQNITVGEAVWRICDSIGFNNYVYDRKDNDPASTLEYYWTEDEDTVWDSFQALAEATQTAIYFDEFDTLRIKTRETAYDLAKSPVWSLEAENTNTKLADVVEANIVANYEANIVNVNYKTTKVSDDNKGLPEMQILWEPEDSFVLRASQLTQQLTPDALIMRINPKEVAFWPYKGMVNIEGELIKYEGKEYSYYDKSNKLVTLWVFTNEEKLNIDKTLTNLDRLFQSTWTGRVKLTERGVYWTTPRTHLVDINGWRGRMTSRNFSVTNPWQGGISHISWASIMRITSPSAATVDSGYVAVRGRMEDAPYRRYGTRLRLSPASHTGAAGIALMLGPSEAGYYIELTPTAVLDANAAALRTVHHEVTFYVRGVAGNQIRYKTARAQIIRDRWYDLDVDLELTPNNGPHNIVVYLDGVVILRHSLAAGRVAHSGRFGAFVRGRAIADYEYFFAHAGSEGYRPDETSHYDKTRQGFVSGQWDREYVYSTYMARNASGVSYARQYNQYFFDEFGPIVHEVREMDVPFEKYPVLHSRFYTSNDSQILCPEYSATPFGAKFMLANTSRQNAVGNGEDTLRFGIDNPVEQKMMVYGRLIYQEEGQVFTSKNSEGKDVNPFQNDDAIRRRGRVEVDIDSRWIQSKAEAEALGNWILKHWSDGSEEVEVETFGNPLFQLGDVVSLHYPDKNLHRDTHRYFIVSIQNDFDTGLSTRLTLRRAKN